MNILSELFQKNQQIGQSPMSIVRTPRQEAYDNLLNKQYDIQQENEKYNTYNNLMSGMGGLGKVLASAFVKNPIEKAGAMNGLTEQEYRTDDLRKAYEQARTNQNKDYVQQAKDQLALAIADEDKALANDWKTKEFDYRKAYDDAKQSLAEKAFNLNKASTDANIAYTNAQTAKTNWELSPEYQEKLAKEKAEKEHKEKVKEANELINSYTSANSISPEDTIILRNIAKNDPDKAMQVLESSGKYSEPHKLLGFFPWSVGGNKNKFKVNQDKLKTVGEDGSYTSSSGNSYTIKVSGM